DQWHVNQKLTVDGGLRWEPQAPIKEIRGRIEQFLPNAAAAGVHSSRFPNAPAGVFFVGDSYGGITVPAGGETADLDNIAPRAGFAYDFKGDGKTVVRGGAGVFYYTRLNTLFGNDASISTPFSLRIDLFPPVPAFQGGGLSNPLLGQTAFTANFPDRYILSSAPSSVVFPNPSTVYSLQPGSPWITPAIYTWNLTVERQLKPDLLFRISYVGNEAANLRQDVDLNPAQYSLYVQNPKLTTNQRRTYPGISDILMDNNSGNSNYNSLQVGLEKRPGTGLPGPFRNMTLLANYTYSKAMQELAQNGGITDIGSSNGSGVPYGNPYQFQFNKGPADFNHTHDLVLSYVWPLPAFAGSPNRLVKSVIGGWNWSGILTLQTGDAMTLTAGQDQSKTGLNGDRVNFLGSVSQLGTGAQQSATACSTSVKFCVPFLNTSLFGLPPVGSFGNIGEGSITGPGHWNWDMALLKNFYPLSSHESFHVQVRGDFLDAFNNPQYNDPSTGLGGNFGRITGASNFRVIQLAAKVFF
ncbi:MAG: carboxypeptidase regulatory-like domain-containing protein, partial [Terriglobia bacterium]